ncbi:MAG: TlpA family protein disulfide reductase [Caldilineaceae bacterium]|nr:TlpA family protein disulfide reductase [Caldilineaceae bacterium]
MPAYREPHPYRISRRALLQATLSIPFAAILVACGSDSQTSARLPSVTLDTFPTGLGRGYPLGTLTGVDNSTTGINKGDVAPNFRLQLSDDQGLYLSDLAGHPILINFWATWCGPCRLEMPEIVSHANNDSDLVVLAINVQEQQEPIAAFAGDFNMTMPVVRDVDADIRDLYKVGGMPTSVFIDRQGKVVTYWMGVMSPNKLEELVAGIL